MADESTFVQFQIGGHDREVDVISICVGAFAMLDTDEQRARVAQHLEARFDIHGGE